MVRGGAAVSTYPRRGGLTTRGPVRYGSRYSSGNFRSAPRGRGFIRNPRPSRFGIRRPYQGGGLFPVRRYTNFSAERRMLGDGLRGTRGRGVGRVFNRGNFRGRFRSARGSTRGGGRGGIASSYNTRYSTQRGRTGVTGRGRGRGRGRGGRSQVTESDLNTELDSYMGMDATKTRLDNQLDVFFGRTAAASTMTTTSVIKPDPLGCPSDVAMNGSNLS